MNSREKGGPKKDATANAIASREKPGQESKENEDLPLVWKKIEKSIPSIYQCPF